jgi:hypothetical protein
VAARVELNYQGISDLLYSEGVRKDLDRRAKAVAARAGDGMSSEVQRGRDRYRGAVWTESMHAKRGEAKDHRLLRALDAAR